MSFSVGDGRLRLDFLNMWFCQYAPFYFATYISETGNKTGIGFYQLADFLRAPFDFR